MRDFTKKNFTMSDILAYHHWLLTFSNLSIIEIIYEYAVLSTCVWYKPLSVYLLFQSGWSISRAGQRITLELFLRDVLLDISKKINKRQMTG